MFFPFVFTDDMSSIVGSDLSSRRTSECPSVHNYISKSIEKIQGIYDDNRKICCWSVRILFLFNLFL